MRKFRLVELGRTVQSRQNPSLVHQYDAGEINTEAFSVFQCQVSQYVQGDTISFILAQGVSEVTFIISGDVSTNFNLPHRYSSDIVVVLEIFVA